RRHTRFKCDWSLDVCSSDLRDCWRPSFEGFQNVLKRDANNLAAIAGLAGIYQNTMDLPKAHDYYVRLEQLDPLKPVAFYAVGSQIGRASCSERVGVAVRKVG